MRERPRRRDVVDGEAQGEAYLHSDAAGVVPHVSVATGVEDGEEAREPVVGLELYAAAARRNCHEIFQVRAVKAPSRT